MLILIALVIFQSYKIVFVIVCLNALLLQNVFDLAD